MKKRSLLVNSLLGFFAFIAILFSVVSLNTRVSNYAMGEYDTYSIVLNNDVNKIETREDAAGFDGNYYLTTNLGNEIGTSCTLVSNNVAGWETFHAGGTFQTVDPIHGITRLELNRANQGQITIHYSADAVIWDYISYGPAYDALIVETFSTMPNYLKIEFNEDTAITSAKIDYTCVEHYYPVNLSMDSTLGIVDGAGFYMFGTDVTVSATPISVYVFDGWYDLSDTLVSTDNPYSFIMPEEEVTLVAKFVIPSKGMNINFGSYPAEKVTYTPLIAELNTYYSALPTPEDSGVWTDYGYYNGVVQEPYMWYLDVTHNGSKYRGVYFIKYRPYSVFSGSYASPTEDSSFIYQNGYFVNNVYWFKYTPLSWKVLDVNENNVFLFTNNILDCQAYDVAQGSSKIVNGIEVSVNNYQYSAIRDWLNNTFFMTAFTFEQQEKINTTLVDNSLASTLDEVNNNICADTNDRLFLLSKAELSNSDYGFEPTTRKLPSTAYAQIQGLASYGYYWTRSPKNALDNSYVTNVALGNLDGYTINRDTTTGVAPALWVTL